MISLGVDDFGRELGPPARICHPHAPTGSLAGLILTLPTENAPHAEHQAFGLVKATGLKPIRLKAHSVEEHDCRNSHSITAVVRRLDLRGREPRADRV